MSGYTQTPNYSLKKPITGSDNDVWGDHWNQNADALDSILATTNGNLAGYLPLAGNKTVTGPTTFSGAAAGLVVTNNATVGGTLAVTSTVSSGSSYLLAGAPFLSAPNSSSLGPTLLLGLGAGKNLGLGTGAQGTVAVGYQAGGGAGTGMTGNENTMVGWNAGGNVTTGSFCTYIGLNCGGLTTVDNNNTCLGNDAMRNSTGAGNVAVGVPVMRDGVYNSCVAIGGLTQNGNASANATGMVVIGIGAVAGTTLATAQNNVVIGTNAAGTMTTASSNIIIGTNSGNTITTGIANTFVGHQSGQATTVQQNCTFIGNVAGKSLGGQSVTAVGSGAMGGGSGGASFCTAIGMSAGNKVTGANNTLLGYSVGGATLTTGSGNIFIGNSSAIDAATAAESNMLRIGANAVNTIRASGINSATPALFLDWMPASTTYANDAAAQTGGVAVGQLYRNGSAIQVRVT